MDIASTPAQPSARNNAFIRTVPALRGRSWSLAEIFTSTHRLGKKQRAGRARRARPARRQSLLRARFRHLDKDRKRVAALFLDAK